MTNKEFFLHTLDAERPVFRAVIDALPEDQMSHKVHEKSREAGNLAKQLAVQWEAVSGVVTKGTVGMETFQKEFATKADMLAGFDQNFDQMKKDLTAISDSNWENDDAALGEMWKTKKYDMSWGFLFDAIHHRGQLSTFLRNMGAKVPNIYGGSADSPMGS